MPTTEHLVGLINAANADPANPKPVDIPDGDYVVREPFPRVLSGVVTGRDPRVCRFRVASDATCPVWDFSNPGSAVPVQDGYWAADGLGWFILSDVLPIVASDPRVYVDATFTLPAESPAGVEHAVFAMCGSVDANQADGRPGDRPFSVSVVGRAVRLRLPGGTWDFPGRLVSGTHRLVFQQTPDRVQLWHVPLSSADPVSLLLDAGHPPLAAAPHASLSLGARLWRFGESVCVEGPPPGVRFHRASWFPNCPFSAAVPPLKQATPVAPGSGLSFIDFADTTVRGVMVRGWSGGGGMWLAYRTTDLGSEEWGPNASGFSVHGEGRCPVGIHLTAAHEWVVHNVGLFGCGYGLSVHHQAYQGVIDHLHADSNRVAAYLGNNSSLVRVRDSHVQAGGFGLVVADAEQVVADGLWVVNTNVRNVTAVGDAIGLAMRDCNVGFEDVTNSNVRLCGVSALTVDGGSYLVPHNPVPAFELHGCSGGVFLGPPRVSLNPAQASAVLLNDHDPVRPPVVVGHNRPWGGVRGQPSFFAFSAV